MTYIQMIIQLEQIAVTVIYHYKMTLSIQKVLTRHTKLMGVIIKRI